jgi:hypothetical protein
MDFSFTLNSAHDLSEIATPVTLQNGSTGKCIDDCRIIWDTGATSSMIAERIAQQLHLPPAGETSITGVHGTERANIYHVTLCFQKGLLIRDLRVASASGDCGFDLLAGMDIIGKGCFIVDGTGNDGTCVMFQLKEC